MIFNPEQQVAVRNIVWKTAFPSPYILFGPPGTGKTTTLVEAIVQIVTRFPDRRILVAAQSNSACNEIAIRLLKYIDSTKMYRFYCRSTKIEKIPEELRQCTTICSGFYIMPTASILAAAQITIGTLTACGRLAQFMIRLEKYSYVFIDECGSATEPATLCGIAGHAFQWQNTALILAGDPYQLGPVVKNAYLVQMGYDISMLERIMGLPLYQKDPVTGKYNTALITKLVRNYRCHEAIIAFSNKHFYDNELSTVAPLEITSLATNCELLPNGDFPIVLHHVFGESQKTGSGTSFYNCDELLVVVEYLEKIFSGAINNRIIPQEEVGVISPYKLQVEYLQLICSNRGWNKVEVGSIEHYQGREKAVIILSTVRSLTSNVGFLNNKKRLNVAVTRAKALLVVVGNCQTLQKDPLWKDFVRYCVDNRATAGKPFYCSQDNDNIYQVDVIDALLNAFML